MCDFRNKNQSYKNMFEVIPISEFMNSEIMITSTFRSFCQAGKLPGLHFEKPLMTWLSMKVWSTVTTIEVFQNEIVKACQPASLSSIQVYDQISLLVHHVQYTTMVTQLSMFVRLTVNMGIIARIDSYGKTTWWIYKRVNCSEQSSTTDDVVLTIAYSNAGSVKLGFLHVGFHSMGSLANELG